MKHIKSAFVFLFFSFLSTSAHAQYLSPRHIYSYAKMRNYRALASTQKYINEKDFRGQTPTCMAAVNQDWQTYQVLVQYGADPEPDCLTPKQLAQVRQNMLQQAQYQANYEAYYSTTTSVSDGTFLGMGALGWTVAGAAAAGVGVAVAAGGGGGGGGGGGCSGFIGDDGKCYEKLNCVHGYQKNADCICDMGYKGRLCDETADYNNYNKFETINVNIEDAATDVIGLEYLKDEGDKIGPDSLALYNAYHQADNPDLTLNKTFSITVLSSNPKDTAVYGLKNAEGAVYNAYVDGSHNALAGALSATIDLTAKETKTDNYRVSEMYGIYAKGDVETIKKINADDVNVTSNINLTFNTDQETTNPHETSMYGIKSTEGSVTNSQNSVIDLFYSNSYTDGRHKVDLYGIDAAKDVVNKGDIMVYGEYDNGTTPDASNRSYGILSGGSVTNKGLIDVETSAQAMTSYGIHADESVDNTDGQVFVSSDTNLAVYGIYTNSAIDMTKIGTVSSINSTFGTAVGVHFGSGSVELTDENTQDITVVGKYIRYLFEGAAGTTITNTATIDAGLKAGTVNNSGKITGALYGIYAAEEATNSGTVNGNYGIYTDAAATNSGMVSGTIYGIYAVDSVNNNTGGTISGNYGIYTDAAATNSGTVNGGQYGIYAIDSVDNTSGTVKASTNINDTVYGIYTDGTIDMAKLGSVSSTNTNADSSDALASAVGVHFGSGSITLTPENTQNISASGGRTRYLFEGEDGTTIINEATISSGLKASNVINSGKITGGQYGIYATDSVDNTDGTVKTSAATNDTAYGIYTEGEIDMDKLGTVDSKNTGGEVVGVHFGSGSITLTPENTQNISASGSNRRFLFEGEDGTTITNTAAINAGLKASNVINSGTINGGNYGIYATDSVDNTGMVTATGSGTVYGIYTDGEIDMAKIGIVSSSSPTYGTAIAVHFGSGSIELTNTNTQNISATSDNISYLFEGAAGTTITNSATIEAGLKAGTVNNSGNISGKHYGIYATEAVDNTGGSVSASAASGQTVYGIYTNGEIDMAKIGTVSSDNANLDTGATGATSVGVHFGSGSMTLTDANTSDIHATGGYKRYLFEGEAGTTITNSATIDAGLKAGTVNNSGNITGGQYGIYATEAVDNTGGSVSASENMNDTVYGIYTDGEIDMAKLGTVSSENTNTAPSDYQTAAVAVRFGSGEIALTDANTSNIHATSANIRYLFEGGVGTTITNAATIDAGLKAAVVNNSGNITGGRYGIYATDAVDNTGGTVTASEGSNSTVYGIYTDGAIDIAKLGTVSSTNSSIGAAVGVHFGSGSIELNDLNLPNISATSSNVRYLFEGTEGTSITNETILNAGLKAGIVNNSGTIHGGQYGIYATEFVDNTGGTVKASTSTADTVYGIYTDGAIDMNKLGEVSSTSTNPSAYAMAVGVHFGSGSIKLTDENTQDITVSGGRIRYLFEGDVGTTITNTAAIDAGLKAAVVKNSGDITGGAYGIYASESFDNTGGSVMASESINDTVYGIYTNGAIDMNKLGTVLSVNTNTSSTEAAAVAVHFGNGSIELTDDNTQNITVTGGYAHYLFEGGVGTTITNTATIYAGLKGYTIYNSGTINSGRYSVYGQGSVTNSGTIESTGSGPAVYINGGSLLNQSSGLIKLNGVGYAVQLTNATLDNKGTISIETNATGIDGIYGICAQNNSKIRNSGTIEVATASGNYLCTGDSCYNGKTESAPYMYLDSTSSYISQGLMLSYSPLNLNQSFGQGNVLLSTGGSFNAPALSGNLGIDSEVVSEGFEESYVLPNAIISDNVSGLNLASQSALFDAALVDEDVVLTKKNFADVVDNSSLAAFLENNYNASNNENLFKMLKGKENVAALNDALNTLTGADVFSRFTFEDLTMMRDLNADVNSKLFENTKDHLEIAGSVTPWNFDGNSVSNSRYALYNTVSGNRSYGLSIAFADVKSNDGHNNNNNRYDQTFYMGVPMGYEAKGVKFISTPTFGYAYGTYDRDGYDGASYEGKIEKRIFGFANEARYPMDFNGWKVMPTAEFNVFGYHIKGHEELKAYSLNIPAQNNLSVESGVGFNLAKQAKLGKNQNLSFNAGIMLYHEFANPYELDLSMNGMNGSFKISDERRKADRAVVRTGFDYKFDKNMSVTGGLAAYFDGTQNAKANMNFKYAF